MIVPSTIVLPGDESFALALLGSVRVHDPVFSFAFGDNSLALKRIVDLVSRSLAGFIRSFHHAFLAHEQHGPLLRFSSYSTGCKPFIQSGPGFLWRPKHYIGHTSMNYLICFLLRFVIVRRSLAMLAFLGERLWVSARQRPRRPDSSELPSLLLYLPGSVVSRYGRILVRAIGGSRCGGEGVRGGSPPL